MKYEMLEDAFTKETCIKAYADDGAFFADASTSLYKYTGKVFKRDVVAIPVTKLPYVAGTVIKDLAAEILDDTTYGPMDFHAIVVRLKPEVMKHRGIGDYYVAAT